jgi:hypothetical protein
MKLLVVDLPPGLGHIDMGGDEECDTGMHPSPMRRNTMSKSDDTKPTTPREGSSAAETGPESSQPSSPGPLKRPNLTPPERAIPEIVIDHLDREAAVFEDMSLLDVTKEKSITRVRATELRDALSSIIGKGTNNHNNYWGTDMPRERPFTVETSQTDMEKPINDSGYGSGKSTLVEAPQPVSERRPNESYFSSRNPALVEPIRAIHGDSSKTMGIPNSGPGAAPDTASLLAPQGHDNVSFKLNLGFKTNAHIT